MDISYSCLEISAFMILRLVYLIIIAMDQINTKYEILALLTQWEMVFLIFRDADVHWI